MPLFVVSQCRHCAQNACVSSRMASGTKFLRMLFFPKVLFLRPFTPQCAVVSTPGLRSCALLEYAFGRLCRGSYILKLMSGDCFSCRGRPFGDFLIADTKESMLKLLSIVVEIDTLSNCLV